MSVGILLLHAWAFVEQVIRHKHKMSLSSKLRQSNFC